MSTRIRRTTARLAFTGAMALGSAGLLVGPAVAQARPYPPPEINVQVVTPGATITVTGSGWGEGTEVTIVRHRGQNRASTEVVTTAEVHEDGSFEAPVTVPDDAAGTELQYVISGVDEQGNAREETRALNVQLTSADMADDADESDLAAPVPATEDDGGTGLALLAGGAVALAGGAAVARRKVRQDS